MQKLNPYLLVLLFVSSFIFINCKSNLDQSSAIYSEGMKLVSAEKLPFNPEATQGVVKILNGATVSNTGIFVSKDGLLITSYSDALEYFQQASSTSNSSFEEGFIAANRSQEVALQSLTLLIEVEQRDVTDIIQEEVEASSTNYEISIITQNAKRKLIEEVRTEDPKLHVQIDDLFSKNRQVLTRYRIIRDVRLVFAPKVKISTSDIPNSKLLSDAISDQYVLLRAYTSASGDAVPYSTTNIPFKPDYNFNLSNEISNNSTDTLIALGYANRTFRGESNSAFRFYNTRTNPYILSSYQAFQEKEDDLASQDPNYALSSLSNRVQIAKNVSFYETVQKSFKEGNLFQIKDSQEKKFMEWVLQDSIRTNFFKNSFWYIDQAYEIAEKTSDIYYSTAYFESLSKLDDLVKLFKPYLEASEFGATNNELASDREELINYQRVQLQELDIDSEIKLLKHFLNMFKAIPEDQQPLIIFDLFYGASEEELVGLISDFIDTQASESFLFNPNSTAQALLSGDIYSDNLFMIIDEIVTTLETARANFTKHFAYLQPAQQHLTRGYLEMDSSIIPDSDGNTLRFNIGNFHFSKRASKNTFYSTIDFSGKAPGSAILNSSGELVGMITAEVNSSVLSNYVYTQEESYTKNIRTSTVLNSIRSTAGSEALLKELDQK
ncbi:MAG: S46 family peptidase [Balneolaceae bacterium]